MKIDQFQAAEAMGCLKAAGASMDMACLALERAMFHVEAAKLLGLMDRMSDLLLDLRLKTERPRG